jgi:V/A-type H+-transporting ATPase subunit K
MVLVLCVLALPVFAQEAGAGTETASEASASAAGGNAVWKYFAAALAVGISCIAGGIAVGQIGSAAMGAMSENPELSGKALPYAGLAEGICLWGFLVALLIMIF